MKYKKTNVILILIFVGFYSEYTGQDNGQIICGFPVELTQADTVLMFPDIMPEFPGGDEAFRNYISENLNYPSSCGGCVRGTVYVKFIITKEGTTESFVMIRGLRDDYDREVIRVLKSIPFWNPGIHEDEPVDTWFTLPIKYDLN